MAESLDDDASESLNAEADTLLLLTTCIDRFVDAWDSPSSPPAIQDFLPKDPSLRAQVLPELIKIDLEYRWGIDDRSKSLHDYFAEFPELSSPDQSHVRRDLIHEEYHVRRQAGNDVDARDFLIEYPEHADELAPLLGISNDPSTSPLASTISDALRNLQVGQQIDDFELLAPLGAGSFARVFLARQISMQRWVALKISMESGDESRTLAQLDHESIVRVFDQRTDNENGLRLLYMQYVPGGTLQDVIKAVKKTDVSDRSGVLLWNVVQDHLERRGEAREYHSPAAKQLQEMSWPATVGWIGKRLATALDEAASQNVLHRDIKPANILLTAEASPKLADFNTSYGRELVGVSAAENFGGSLAYMSPEQLEAFHPRHPRKAESLNAASDQYSLAVLLWELLTGSRPFEDKDLQGTATEQLDAMIAIRKSVDANAQVDLKIPELMPRGLYRVLKKSLAVHPEQRWNSARELADQLRLCQNERAEQLLYPSPECWVNTARNWIYSIVFGLILVPNILASIFNYYYNRRFIVEYLQDATGKFWSIQVTINSIAYTAGIGLLSYLTLRVAKAVHRHPQSMSPANDETSIRHECLNLGHTAAVVCMIEWAIAGMAYPLSIQLSTGNLPLDAYLHFFGSLFLCGLIAAAFPFFGVSFFCLRVAYPRLLRRSLGKADDVTPLVVLRHRSWRYLMMAWLVPLLGIASLVLMDLDARFVMGILSVGAIVGASLVFGVFSQLQADIEAILPLFNRRHSAEDR